MRRPLLNITTLTERQSVDVQRIRVLQTTISCFLPETGLLPTSCLQEGTPTSSEPAGNDGPITPLFLCWAEIFTRVPRIHFITQKTKTTTRPPYHEWIMIHVESMKTLRNMAIFFTGFWTHHDEVKEQTGKQNLLQWLCFWDIVCTLDQVCLRGLYLIVLAVLNYKM